MGDIEQPKTNKWLWLFSFIWKNWRGILMVILGLMAAIQTKRISNIQDDASTQLELKDGELAKIRVELGRLQAITANGSTNNYRPPEANTVIIVKENKEMKERLKNVDAQLANLEKDKVKNAAEIERLRKEREEILKRLIEVQVSSSPWGFVLKPGLGALYSGEILPEIDAKFLFIQRYSAKFGVTTQFVDVGISRHVDDFIPVFHFQNLEIQGVYGREFRGGTRWGIGLRSNL